MCMGDMPFLKQYQILVFRTTFNLIVHMLVTCLQKQKLLRALFYNVSYFENKGQNCDFFIAISTEKNACRQHIIFTNHCVQCFIIHIIINS